MCCSKQLHSSTQVAGVSNGTLDCAGTSRCSYSLTQVPDASQLPMEQTVRSTLLRRDEQRPVVGSTVLVPVWHSLAARHVTGWQAAVAMGPPGDQVPAGHMPMHGSHVWMVFLRSSTYMCIYRMVIEVPRQPELQREPALHG